MNTLLTKYGAVILPAILTLLGTLQLFLADDIISGEEGGQLIVLSAGLVITYFVPLLKSGWAGALKTGMQVLVAIGMLIIPLVQGGLDTQALIAFVFTALNALATEIGVQARTEPVVAEVLADGTAVITSLPVATATRPDGTVEVGIFHSREDDALVLDEDADEVRPGEVK